MKIGVPGPSPVILGRTAARTIAGLARLARAVDRLGDRGYNLLGIRPATEDVMGGGPDGVQVSRAQP